MWSDQPKFELEDPETLQSNLRLPASLVSLCWRHGPQRSKRKTQRRKNIGFFSGTVITYMQIKGLNEKKKKYFTISIG